MIHSPVQAAREAASAPKPFDRVSFSRQFHLGALVWLIVAMVVSGLWLSRQIEQSSLNRAAAIAAVYVESILVAQLHSRTQLAEFDAQTHAELDRVFLRGPLQRKVVRFKLWNAEGTIVYSSDHAQVGRSFPVDDMLAEALTGNLQSRVSDLTDDDNQPERERWSRLLEVYVPLRAPATGAVIGVAEFYHSMENLGKDIHLAQQRSWMLVSVTTIALYLALLGLVRRANNTIVDQRQDLREQLQQLRASLAENRSMRLQLREAGERTTTLNEKALHRLAADLHDGPAQDLSFALLRFDDLVAVCGCGPSGDLEAMREALRRALEELRGIASGIGIPGIAELSLAATLRRAVLDFEHRTATAVEAEIDNTLDQASIATKITAYRVLQESLNNAWQHAPGNPPQVRVRAAGSEVGIEVFNAGAGFDPAQVDAGGRLGIAFMRERVRLLGGSFDLESAPGQGTRVLVRLPLSPETSPHD
ncbi:MAG: sensor histidine kinase [Sulfuritalea sp.]|nr:sensor histidine kinase [Sulfuritalea sp.]